MPNGNGLIPAWEFVPVEPAPDEVVAFPSVPLPLVSGVGPDATGALVVLEAVVVEELLACVPLLE